jgi:1,4-alpha-glucan branching enzyme
MLTSNVLSAAMPYGLRQRQGRPILPSGRPGMGAIPHQNGTTFRVWAPNADKVFVTGTFNHWSLRRNPMARESGGFWSTEVSTARVGDEYKFVIQNGQEILVRTDPYARDVLSPRENSVICDRAEEQTDLETDKLERFEPPATNELVIYELHVGTFSQKADGRPGDFNDVIDKLPYLQSLGINAIELMPVVACEGDQFWGYEPAQPFAVSRNYGGPEALKRLVVAAHDHGIAVIIDVIYNHLGPWGLNLWRFDGWSETTSGESTSTMIGEPRPPGAIHDLTTAGRKYVNISGITCLCGLKNFKSMACDGTPQPIFAMPMAMIAMGWPTYLMVGD